MGRMVTTENIISLIRTIPISVHKGQHALLLADNSAESIALFGFFLKNNVPLILLNASMRDEQVQEYMDEYRHSGLCIRRTGICHNIPVDRTSVPKTERGINAMKLPVSGTGM